MYFNSIDFAVFLPIVFFLYWFVTHKNLKAQNVLIVFASYVFYGWWDWRFLSLILCSTLIDYFVGLGLGREQKPSRRKRLLWVSIAANLSFLGFFKYYNFFLDNFVAAFSIFGTDINANTLNIILPVGISFYTFQTLSYSIDCYRRKLAPTKDFFSFAAFVSFFPQLVAGPIERATHLLPQFEKPRYFKLDQAADGMRQMLWGLFKKMVIADNCGEFANLIFNDSSAYSGSTLLLGAVFFTFQIYGDFSGYSDIAIGTARLFGFDLRQNFAYPFFSRDIAEFWRRWHISLSTWFRDYVYIPLGGSRGGTSQKVRNTFIIFIVSGFWHGANWTFIVWGLLNALYFLPLLLTDRNRDYLKPVAVGRLLPSLKESISIALTFGLTVLAFTVFRAESIGHAGTYLLGLFSPSLFTIPEFVGKTNALITAVLVLGFLGVEWLGRTHKHALEGLDQKWNRPARWIVYSSLVFLTGMYMQTAETPFIYFQF